MSDSMNPLPLNDVMDIVDRRKRRRAKARAATVSAAAVAGLGVAGVGAVMAFTPDDETAAAMPAAAGPSGVDSAPTPPALEASATDVGSTVPTDIDLGSVSETAAFDAYFAAGYSYEDALVIASAWGLGVDYAAAKIEAGRYLAQGVSLEQTPYGHPSFDDHYDPSYLADYFYSYGYTAADAATLAQQWALTTDQAATRGGSELKVNLVLPWVDPPVDENQAALDAFFAAGCTFDDAETLAEFWDLADPFDAKIMAGRLFVTGEPLPVTTPAIECSPEG